MESMINTLYLRLKGEPLTETPDHHLKNFLLIERDDDGSVLHGFVKQISPSDYHIFVRLREKHFRNSYLHFWKPGTRNLGATVCQKVGEQIK
jgi:hypothetical protein